MINDRSSRFEVESQWVGSFVIDGATAAFCCIYFLKPSHSLFRSEIAHLVASFLAALLQDICSVRLRYVDEIRREVLIRAYKTPDV